VKNEEGTGHKAQGKRAAPHSGLVPGAISRVPSSLTVLALDPSSSCCGFALARVEIDRPGNPRYTEAGRFLPRRVKDDAFERIDAICESLNSDLTAWMAQWDQLLCPTVALIEAPKKPQARQGSRSVGSMWTYGIAVGSIIRTVRARGITVLLVDPADWAKRTSKAHRPALAQSLFPEYDPDRDAGADTADAIVMLRWWAMDRMGAWIKATAEAAENKRRAG
jgi:hypothetical protein